MCQFSTTNFCDFEDKFYKWYESFSKEFENLKKFSEVLDSEGKCLFHSHDRGWKRANHCYEYLRIYINLSLKDEKLDAIDFCNAIAVGDESNNIDLSSLTINKNIKIKFSVFEDTVDFRNTIFDRIVDIYKAEFNSVVYFNAAVFKDRTLMNNCIFNKSINFNFATFTSKNGESNLSFTQSIFSEQANFSNTKFLGNEADVNFQLVHFYNNVYFTGSQFERHAIFNGTIFDGSADFRRVCFKNGALFNDRIQNDKLHIVEFTNVDFSDAKFEKDASFNQSAITEGSFKNTFFKGNFSFNNSIIGLISFDNIQLESDSLINFRGLMENQVFTKSTSFNLDREKILGKLMFENCKISWISKLQVDLLLGLQAEGKVYFDDNCEFEANVKILTYNVSGTTGSYHLLKTVFLGLERWVSLFTNGIQASLIVEPSNRLNEVKLKIVWKRYEDEKLFQKLAIYYFECLNEKSDFKLTQIIDGITSNEFLNTFSTEQNIYYSNLNGHLTKIIKRVMSEFEDYLKICSIELSDNLHKDQLEISSTTKLNILPKESIFLPYLFEQINDLINLILGANTVKLTLNIVMKTNTIQNSGDNVKFEGISQSNENINLPESSIKNIVSSETKRTPLSLIPEWARILAGLGAIAGLIKVIYELA